MLDTAPEPQRRDSRPTRLFFHHATENELRETVEKITGREVWALIGGIDAEQDVSLEAFYLEPATS